MAAIMLTKTQRDSYLKLAQMWRKLGNEAGNHRQRVEAWTRRTGRAPTGAPDLDADREPELGPLEFPPRF
jgi:hypothetical protein